MSLGGASFTESCAEAHLGGMPFAFLLTFFPPGMWSQWLDLRWPCWAHEVTLMRGPEKLNIQPVCENRTRLWPAQETNPSPPVASPGSRPAGSPADRDADCHL